MTVTITAFERSPDGGKGLARDTRVRWALEEAGQAYEVRGMVQVQCASECPVVSVVAVEVKPVGD